MNHCHPRHLVLLFQMVLLTVSTTDWHFRVLAVVVCGSTTHKAQSELALDYVLLRKGKFHLRNYLSQHLPYVVAEDLSLLRLRCKLEIRVDGDERFVELVHFIRETVQLLVAEREHPCYDVQTCRSYPLLRHLRTNWVKPIITWIDLEQHLQCFEPWTPDLHKYVAG